MATGIANVKGSGGGSNFLTTTTDATFINQTYELALSYLSNTPKVNDYVAFVENEKVINIYKVNSVDTTKAYMQIVYNGANCLMTKTIKYDEKAGWLFYYGSSQPWHRWASISNPTGLQIPSTDKTKPKARSLSWKAMSLFDLTTGVEPTVDAFAVTATDFVVRPGSNNIITTQEQFDAYMAEHPFVMEYLLVESSWGGL